jgi:hypothetical protein
VFHVTSSSKEEAFQILLELRARIGGIPAKNAIVVLPEEEGRKPVPRLPADEALLLGSAGDPMRVLDALFVEGL